MNDTTSAFRGRVAGVAATAALGGFLFGYDSAVINGAVSAIQSEFDLSSAQIGFTVASALLGAAAGAWATGSIAERLGRVQTMFLAAGLFFISAILSGLAPTNGWLVVWRIVGGVAVGIASVIAPMYIAEVAPAKVRGRLGSLQQMAIVVGIFVSQLVNYAIVQIAGGSATNQLWGLDAWRWMFIVEAIPALIYGLLALRLPESPRYLMSRQKRAEATVVLASFDTPDLEGELDRIEESVRGATTPRMSDLRGHALGLAPIVWVGLFLAFFQQATGINVIFYYSAALWESVGIESSQALLISIISAAVNIAGTVVAIMIIDKVGRRALLRVGSSGIVVSLAITSLAFSTATLNESGSAVLETPWSTVALLSANAFVFFFAFSWGPVVWVLLGEMFPNRLRAAGLAVAAAVNWLANYAVTQTFPVMAENLGLGGSYLVFAIFGVLSLIFVVKFVPETKGRSLEDMHEELAAKI